MAEAFDGGPEPRPFYCAQREQRLNQGDLLDDVMFLRRAHRGETTSVTALGLVISHDCECDKLPEWEEKGQGSDAELNAVPITVAPVLPFDQPRGKARGKARASD